MTPETLTALRGSIAKWRAIVAGTAEDKGTENCPLCAAFYSHGECAGCPAAEVAQDSCCRGTPYMDWANYWAESGQPYDPALGHWDLAHVPVARLPEVTAMAQAELDFLISLLPEGASP